MNRAFSKRRNLLKILIIYPGIAFYCLLPKPSFSKELPSDTTRTVIITKDIYHQIQDELQKLDSTTTEYRQLASLKINDSLSFQRFVKLMEYKTEPLFDVLDKQYKDSQQVVINRALLSEINRKLSLKYQKYEFYEILENAEINDTIPLRYFEYLSDIQLYTKDMSSIISKKEKMKDTIKMSLSADSVVDTKTKDEELRKEPKPSENDPVEESERHFVFRVQIAASKVPLTNHELESIYTGSKQIYKNHGDGWYRYSVGNCPTYQHAMRLKKYLQLPGVFEVLYKGDKRINAFKYKDQYDLCRPIHITDQLKERKELHYKIQIAASRQKLSRELLRKIYCGEQKVFLSYEEGWYKYSIGTYDTQEKAREAKDSLCVPGAFIVAYKDYKKIPLP
jgi:hypothetical protein